MTVVVLGIVAAVVLLWVLRDQRSDDPRRRHPSTGGACKANPYRQPIHVRLIITERDTAEGDG